MVMARGLGAGLRTIGVWVSLRNGNGSREPQVAVAGSLWGLNPASFWPEGDFSFAMFLSQKRVRRDGRQEGTAQRVLQVLGGSISTQGVVQWVVQVLPWLPPSVPGCQLS